ncbi:MAG: RNA polymerase sigma factor [Cyanobacteria bacterium REEB65]|nr:RNA polymerase sigma factor [Cyanobacteria bacterium REEB65]
MADKALEEQVYALRERKDGAVEALVQQYTGPLMGAAFALGFSETDAEELVQETFAALLSSISRFEMRSQLKTYLFGILYNKAATLRGKQRREESLDPQEPAAQSRFDKMGMWTVPPKGPEDAALNDELRDWIRRCAEGLSLTQRAALFLKEADGEETESVCNVLRLSHTNLRVLLHRARNKMRECLEKHWD